MVNKNLLMNAIAGLTSIAALGLSGLSFAGGDYTAAAPAPAAPALEESKSGLYIGARAGYGDNHWNKPVGKISGLEQKHTGFAGGAEIGYAFNKYLSLEGGFMYLPEAKFHFKGSKDSIRIQNRAFDVVGKFSLPIPSIEQVGVFAKAGVA